MNAGERELILYIPVCNVNTIARGRCTPTRHSTSSKTLWPKYPTRSRQIAQEVLQQQETTEVERDERRLRMRMSPIKSLAKLASRHQQLLGARHSSSHPCNSISSSQRNVLLLSSRHYIQTCFTARGRSCTRFKYLPCHIRRENFWYEVSASFECVRPSVLSPTKNALRSQREFWPRHQRREKRVEAKFRESRLLRRHPFPAPRLHTL